MPVPRPVTTAGSAPVNAQISAAEAVVLAMPMSPVTRQRLPAATRSRATSMPASRRAHGLLPGHRGARGEVGGAGRDLAGQQAGRRSQVGGDTDVDHDDLGARPAPRTR